MSRALDRDAFDRAAFDIEMWDDDDDETPSVAETWTPKTKQAETWTPEPPKSF
ncbi:hypothetical protein [uncultured Bradyrhizobium sp.]|uniref:hypothetical protein n=1 Tax=uncultured Bradyrhizobium sp. TaxID=199684 RepID=UPI0035CC06C8